MNKENNQYNNNLSYIFSNDIHKIDIETKKNADNKEILNNNNEKKFEYDNQYMTNFNYNTINKYQSMNMYSQGGYSNSNSYSNHIPIPIPNTNYNNNYNNNHHTNLNITNNAYQSISKHKNNNTQKNQTICKFHLTNTCMKGNNCNFSHDMKSLPCKFFHALGYCDKGNDCSFGHIRFMSEKEVFVFIENNIDFINELNRKIGRTNIDEFYKEYMKINQKHYMNSVIPDEYDRNDRNDGMYVGMNRSIGNVYNNMNMNSNMIGFDYNFNTNLNINKKVDSIENIIDDKKLIPNRDVNPFEINY